MGQMNGKLKAFLVDGDPLQDITSLRDKTNIRTVLKGGQPVPQLNV